MTINSEVVFQKVITFKDMTIGVSVTKEEAMPFARTWFVSCVADELVLPLVSCSALMIASYKAARLVYDLALERHLPPSVVEAFLREVDRQVDL